MGNFNGKMWLFVLRKVGGVVAYLNNVGISLFI